MKRLITLIIALIMLVPNNIALAEQNSESVKFDEVSSQMPVYTLAEIECDSEKTTANINEKEIEAFTHEEARTYRDKMQSFNSGISLMSLERSEGNYSEVVYIETVEDLIAVDGHEGGYYELRNDINFGGRSQKPIHLENATINGNGFTIKNITLTSGKYYTSDSYVTSFIYGQNYIKDLKFKNFEINKSYSNGSYNCIAPFVGGYLDNCTLEGNIDIRVSGDETNVQVYAVNAGADTVYEGNINADGEELCFADILNKAYGCRFYGDVRAELFNISAISGGGNNLFSGDMVLEDCYDMYGIYESNGSRFTGDINVSFSYEIVGATMPVYAILNSEKCVFKGDIIGGSVNGITNSKECIVNGDINGTIVVGINSGSGNVFNGDVSGKDVRGIFRGSDNVLNGDVTGEGRQISNDIDGYGQLNNGYPITDGIASGILGGSSNVINGDIFATNNAYGFSGIVGVEEGKNCVINGNITSGLILDVFCYDYRHGSSATVYGNISSYYTDFDPGWDSKDYIYGDVFGHVPYYKLCDASAVHGTATVVFDKHGITLVSGPGSPSKIIYYTDGGLKVLSSPPDNGYTLMGGIKRESIVYDEDDEDSELEIKKQDVYSLRVVYADSDIPVANAQVNADGKQYITDENGIAVLKQSRLIAGLSVSLGDTLLYSTRDYYATAGNNNTIRVHSFNLQPEDFFFGNSGTQNITGPSFSLRGEKSPIFDFPFSIDANFWDIIKMAYNYEEKTWQVILGTNPKLNLLKDNGSSNDSDWVEAFSEHKKIYNDIISGRLTDEQAMELNSNRNKELKFSMCGYMEIDAEGEHEILNGGIIISGGIEINGSMPVPSVPLVFFAYGVGGSLTSSLEFYMSGTNYLDPEYTCTGESTLSGQLSGGVGVGGKNIFSLEIGLEGNVDFTLTAPFNSFKDNFKAELSASIYALLSTLGQEWKQAKKFANLEIYPNFHGELMTLSIDSVSQEDLTAVPRDYLNTPVLYSDNSVKEAVYPYTDVQTATLSDGKVIMVWLDDNPERDDANRTSLYYSILNNGVWSEAAEINNDGTGDFSFTLSSYGNQAAVLWQNIKKKMSDSDAIDVIAQNSELSYIEFDGTTWGTPLTVTENKNYEYAPKLYTYQRYINSSPLTSYIAWIENDTNNPIPLDASTTETVYTATISNGTISEPVKVMDTTERISEIAVSRVNNAIVANNKLYVDGVLLKEGEISDLDYYGTDLYFTENDKIYTYGIDYYGTYVLNELCSAPKGTTVIENKVAIFEVTDGFNSDLYASYKGNYDVWTSPVKITDFGKKIRSWSAFFLPDGTLYVAAALADMNVESSDVSQYVSLNVDVGKPVRDIKLATVSVDNVVRGENAEFTLNVTNNTGKTLSNLDITVSGAEVIYEKRETTSIADGETKELKVKVPIPENFEKQQVKVEIASDTEENGIDNNSKAFELGQSDAEIKMKIYKESGRVKITVSNNGCEDIENALLVLKGKEEISREYISLAAGETKRIKKDISDYLDFDENKVEFTAEIQVEDNKKYNNKAAYMVYKDDAILLTSDTYEVMLSPGQSEKPSISSEGQKIYMASSDESIATVSEDGTITAVAYGTAVISYMVPNAINAINIPVTVCDLPVITDMEYKIIPNNESELIVHLDTKKCLGNNKGYIITKAYDMEGNEIGKESQSIMYGGSISMTMNIQQGGKPVKVKVEVEPNNEDITLFVKKEFQLLSLDMTNERIKQGESIKPNISVYPEGSEYTLIAVSEDESVAEVSEDGTITAVGSGDTCVTYMTENSPRVTVGVYTREMSDLVIKTVKYMENDNFKGVLARIDLWGCMSKNERATVIATSYNYDGSILTIQLFENIDIWCGDIWINTNGVIPAKVRLMLWDNINQMTPMAYAAEKTLEEMSSPIIQRAEYVEYELFKGVEVTLDLWNCITDYEDSTLIGTAYDEEGNLLAINLYENIAAWLTEIRIDTNGVPPAKIKLMLWDNMEQMTPKAYPAEKAVEIVPTE